MTALYEGYIPQPPPPPPVPSDTPGRIRWLRELRGLSIRSACAETGISKGDWDGLEAGHRGPRFIDNLLSIATAWPDDNGRPVNLDWLLARDVTGSPDPTRRPSRGRVTDSKKLPHLDSDQEPTGYRRHPLAA